MKSARHLVGRSLAWLVIGIAVFVGVLGTLPVPQVAEGPAEGVHQQNFAITDVTVVDGEIFRHGWDVWVEDGRIRHAGQRLDLPEELPRLDGRGHTLIPGLVDGHVHTFGSTLNNALRFGVTTVMDQFTPPAFVATKRGAREEVGPGTEADLFSAGMAATTPGGHGTQYGVPVETLTGPDEAAAWMRARRAEGSDWIKIIYEDGSAYGREIPSLDRETVAALVTVAHAEGLAAVVHVWHDEVISEADARRFAEADIFVVPTLSVMASADDSAVAELVRETDEAVLSPMQRQTLADRFAGGLREAAAVSTENVRRLRAAGVRLRGHGRPQRGNRGGNLDARGAAKAISPTWCWCAATSSRTCRAATTSSRSVRMGIWWSVGWGGAPAVAAPQAEAAPAPAATLVADFENGLEATFGTWDVTTDQMAGGSSSANVAVRDGALVVTGEIAPGLAFPWAGVIWMPGEQPMQPVDFSGHEVIRFQTRGDGREYSVMLISSATPAGPPPTVTFVAPEEGTQVEMRLEGFPTATSEIIGGLAFVAVRPVGGFEFELDDLGRYR